MSVPDLQRPYRWYGLAALVVLVDQLSKLWVVQALPLWQGIQVSPVFNLVHVYNPGASFSFLAAAGGWQRWMFLALALAVTVWIAHALWTQAGSILYRAGLSLIMGGALGNGLDRLIYGAVVDFLDFHWGDAHFPAFNGADTFINLGVICLVLQYIQDVRHERANQAN